ncbi:unnamed protein product [Lactuca virosa]|uniref:Pentacotripeptide-repeat region of PRORP domain-containing protein n=1 Tax=Lactuca virosa TaxID=75947 RepID=A0AAU9PBK1_9ASTR|nr:unnamed protein product [Lactuca virosa]
MKSTFRKLNDAEYNCMISSMIKLNELKEAENIYTEWESVSITGDSRVPNLILAAYINKNEMKMAENFFEKRMVEKGIVPSYTSWELLTYGCVHEKEMDKVLECFKKAIGSVKKWDPDEKIVRKVYGMLEEYGNVEGAEQVLVTLRDAGERMKKDKVELNDETYQLIKLLHRKYSGNFLVNMLGKWKESEYSEQSVPVGGLAYYVTAPSQGND